MKRAAVYARVSTEHQTSSSLETQIKTCTEFCNRQGWLVVEIFQERDSGAKTERTEFQKMIAKALAGEYDVIVVEKFDRFFRDDVEDRRYTRMLESKGILVISALEGIDVSSVSGKLLRWILSDINWFQREYMKEEQMRKSKHAAQQGFWMGGTPPFGFKLIEIKDGERKRKKLAIDEETAPIVREMFRLFAEGYSVPSIVNYLNTRKLYKDKPWSVATVYDMLRNPKYLGIYTWDVPRRHLESEDGVVAEGVIPAIVTGEVAEKVRKRLATKRRPSFYTQKHFWLLSGILVCGICGKHMHGNPHPRRPVYRCEENHAYLGISKQYVEDYVVRYVRHALEDVDIEALVREYVAIFKTRAEILQTHKKEVVLKLKELEEEERRIVDAIAKGIELPQLFERAKAIEAEQRKLRAELEQEVPVPSYEEIKLQFENLKHILESPSEPNKLKYIIQHVIDKVYVYPGRIVIVKFKWETYAGE